jgi:hypothetical protein
MEKFFISFLLMVLAYGCDAPQRTAAPPIYVNGNSLANPSNASGSFNTSGSSSGTVPNNSSGGSAVVTTTGFESCNITEDKYRTMDIGNFNICQSTQDETVLKLRTALPSTSIRICIIPTYKDNSGSSTWIGQPQCTYTASGQIVSGKLYKDRNGFTSYPLNGAIVMKEPLLPEYFNCMQAYTNWPGNLCTNGTTNSYCSYWLPRCPYGPKSNAQCDMEGRNYMASICNNFKTKDSNSYLDIKLK